MKTEYRPGRLSSGKKHTGKGCVTEPPMCGLPEKGMAGWNSHPGCYDISSAGHIPAGVDFIPSALRELKEELGIEANPEELIYCGVRKGMYEDVFYGRRFVDNQISNVYLLWKNDLEIEEYTIQESEIESICFMEFEACYEAVAKKQIPNCIALMELDMLKAKF